VEIDSLLQLLRTEPTMPAGVERRARMLSVCCWAKRDCNHILQIGF